MGAEEALLSAYVHVGVCREHQFLKGGSAVSDLQETLGAVIRRERRARGRTMRRLAGDASVSTVYLGEIERGKKYPSAVVLEQLARALGLEPADVLALVADELRERARPKITRAVGFQVRPQVTVTRLLQQGEPRMALVA